MGTAKRPPSWVFDDGAALFRLNADCLHRFLCAGNPVSVAGFVILGGDGGLASPTMDRSLISPTRPKPGFAVDAGLEDVGASISSSEESSI